MATEAEKIATWTRFIEATDGNGKFDDTFVRPDFSMHFRNGFWSEDLAGLQAQFDVIGLAYPEFKQTIKDVFVSGNKLASLVEMNSGPHSGYPVWDIFTEETKGRSFIVDELHIVRFDDDGRMAEQWAIPDALSIMDDFGRTMVDK